MVILLALLFSLMVISCSASRKSAFELQNKQAKLLMCLIRVGMSVERRSIAQEKSPNLPLVKERSTNIVYGGKNAVAVVSLSVQYNM